MRPLWPVRPQVRPIVLVVDDEAAIRNFVDLLVTDLMMPGMNGDELARRLREARRDLPVLHFTEFSDRLFANRQQLWEAEAFLDEPCSVQGLLEAVAHGSETILVVEDKDGLRHLAERVLLQCGYTVLAAANAEEALRASGGCGTTIDLLLTDVVMPGADGVLLSRRLKVRRPSLRVLFMSGYSGRDLADRHTHDGDISLLQKPFTRAALAAAVRKALDAGVGAPAFSA